MSTVTFNLVTRPYTGSYTFRVSLYKTSDPLALVTSQEANGPTPETKWTFPGLDKVNWICRITEVDGATVINQLDEFTVVPNGQDTEFKQSILVQIGVTPIPGGSGVFPANVSSVTVPDWATWEIIPERIGTGVMKKDFDYSYDPVTVQFNLIYVDDTGTQDTFQDKEFFYISFVPKTGTGGGVQEINAELWKERKVITSNTTLDASDIGKKILVKASSPYIEITMPAIATVVENRLTFFEFCRGSLKNCRIIFPDASLDWLEGGLTYIDGLPNEMLEIYKEVVDINTSEWRVNDSDGNFKTVGHQFTDDNSTVINAQELNGLDADYQQFARFYDRYIMKLPPSQVVSYAAWAVGNNKYKFSYKDAITGKFRFPDRRNMFERITDGTRLPGDYQDANVGDHQHIETNGDDLGDKYGQTTGVFTVGNYTGPRSNVKRNLTSKPCDSTGNLLIVTKTQPEHIAVRKFVLI